MGDSSYIVKALYEWVEANKLPLTGENMRKALLAIRSFETPLVGKIIVNEDHTVNSATYLIRVVKGKFTYMDTIPAE